MEKRYEQILQNSIDSEEVDIPEQEIETDDTVSKKETLSRRRFVQICAGIAALTALESMVPTSLLKAEENLEEEKPKEEFTEGINYPSEETRQLLQQYERFYEDLKSSEIPVIIATDDDILENLDPMMKEKVKFQFGAVAAFMLNPAELSEKFVKKLGLQKDALYIQYNSIALEESEKGFSTAYHEGRHVKHHIDDRQEHGDNTGKIVRFPELSDKLNRLCEELITNEETIQFLQQQLDGPDNSVLTSDEMQHCEEKLKSEMIYARDNYFKYHWERHGKRANVPCGEFPVTGPEDQWVEDIWKRNNLIKVMGEDSNTFLQFK